MSAALTPWLSFAPPLLVLAAVAIALLLRGKRARTSPPDLPGDETVTVPVRALYLRHRGFAAGVSHNSFNPHFAIAPDGVQFRVLRQSRLRFSDIDHVEIRERFGFVYLLLVIGVGPRLLSVNVGDRNTAKLVLNTLPRNLTLTPEAAMIRDGTPAAGTSDLRQYGGRFA